MKKLRFKGIDSFNRPVFVSVESPNCFYGSLDILFGFNSTEEEVLSKITEKDLCYFGYRFDCEPTGTAAGHIKIQRPEAMTTTATRVVEQTDNKVPFALPWRMVVRKYVFAIVDANGDDVTYFSKNLLSYRGIVPTDTIKEIDKRVRVCAEMIVRCCNNHKDTENL